MTSNAPASWHDGPLAGFDLETTGINTETARIVTAAVIDLEPGKPPRSLTWLADPGIEIPAETTAVHGITTEKAQTEGRPAKEVVAEVAFHVGSRMNAGIPAVAMNGRYDFTVLDRELRRHDLPTLEATLGRPVGPVIDPFILDKQVDRYRKGKRTLEALATHYGAVLAAAHTADADALAGVQVAVAMAARYPQLRMPAEEMHTTLVRWAAAQAEDFEAYKRRTIPGFIADKAWPVIPHTDPVTLIRAELEAMRTVVVGHLAEALLDGKSDEVRTWARGIAYELDVAGVNVDAAVEARVQQLAPGTPPVQPSRHPF